MSNSGEKSGIALIADLFGVEIEENPQWIWVDGLGKVRWVWSNELNDHVLTLVEEDLGVIVVPRDTYDKMWEDEK